MTEAVKLTFDSDYIAPQFRNIHASIEFPSAQQDYPAIWVDYSPTGNLQVMGVAHKEYDVAEDGATARSFTRWRYQGEASFTIVAMSSLERDLLYDEMVRVLAFGKEAEQTAGFRNYIEDNEFLIINFDFDEIGQRGFAGTLGTPWGTDEMVYEAEIAMECQGEFISDSQGATLIPLSDIDLYPYADTEPDPLPDPTGWQ